MGMLVNSFDSLMEGPFQVRLVIVLAVMMRDTAVRMKCRTLPDIFQSPMQQGEHVLGGIRA